MRVDRVSRWLLLCVCLVTWPALAQQSSAPRDLGKFFDAFTDEWVRRDPDLATATRYFSGEEQDQLEQQLTPNTRAWTLERIALARRGLARARQVRARASSTTRSGCPRDLMRWHARVGGRGEKYMDYRFPLDQFGGANVQLVETLTLRHPMATEKDASNYVKRAWPRSASAWTSPLVEAQRLAGKEA